MIALAAKANIPIVSITSNDPINVEVVLSDTLKEKARYWPLQSGFDVTKATLVKAKLDISDYFFTLDPEFICDDKLYNWLVGHEKVLFLVNHKGSPYSFNAGELVVSTDLISSILKGVVSDKAITDSLPILKGLSLKGVSELIRLSSAQGEVSPRALQELRHYVSARASGLETVDKTLGVYFPNEKLKSYVDLNADYFNLETPVKLRPRGLLLHGLGGTGKSMASKYIATRLDVPLFRLDLSASLSKYVGSCHTPDTLFLTDSGAKLFSEITSKDRLATYNRITGELEYQYPTARHISKFSGKMVSLDHTRVKALVTPNHRMVTEKIWKSGVGFEYAGALCSENTLSARRIPSSAPYKGIPLENDVFIIPSTIGSNNCFKKEMRIPLPLFLEFLGYFISEGYLTKKRGGIHLFQNTGPILDRMIFICSQIGNVNLTYSRSNQARIAFSNLSLWVWLKDTCGDKSKSLRLPSEIIHLPVEMLTILITAMVAGYGSIPRLGALGSWSYHSRSKTLIDQVEIIALHMGMTPRITPPQYKIKGSTSGRHNPMYTVYASTRKTNQIYPEKHLSEKEYEGDVVCFTVPNGTLLTKYKNTWLISGNSEQNMAKILASAKNESSVLLLDEVEKLFGESDDSGVTYRLLAQLLWFLQEHKELIITVMTSNNISKLPPELYRSGRIDKVIELSPMNGIEAKELVKALLEDLGLFTNPRMAQIHSDLVTNHEDSLTPAFITSLTYEKIKENKWFK